MRASHNTTPALFLTALGDIDDLVEGLQAGADDYRTKPFGLTELEARVAALGRRAQPFGAQQATTLEGGDIVLDLLKQSCIRHGQAIDLKTK